jgi:hypothetical protein
MKEIQKGSVGLNNKHCSDCIHGHQIVAHIFGEDIKNDGSETRWSLVDPRPIGQTRNCFGFITIKLFKPERFIYPNGDDTCINPQKFKHRSQSQ